jgi:hypothetical protein
MKIRTLVVAAYAAVTLATISPTFAHDVGDKVTPNFEQAIPNIPGKSLITVVVDYPPGAASRPHAHAGRPSSTPTSLPEKFSRR